jgi:DedD protein
MSQVSHTAIPLTNQIRNHWIVAVSALLALVVTAAVVLVLAIDGESIDATAPVAQSSHPTARADGGPDESRIAASIGSASEAAPPAMRPDESKVAASIGSASEAAPPAMRPDESKVAASIGSASEAAPPAMRPDESKVAASIGSASEAAPPASRPDESKVAASIAAP